MKKICSLLALFVLLGVTSGSATLLTFTNPGGNDTTGNTLVDQSLLYDYRTLNVLNTVSTNYATPEAGFTAFNNGNGIVWTTDDQTSVPYASPVVANLGNFSHTFTTVNYTKLGTFGSLLTDYANDLQITMADTATTLRFATITSDLTDHVVGGGGNPTGGQIVTFSFSENVKAFALSFTTPRTFAVNVYDNITGGNLIGSFTTTSDENVIWSAGNSLLPNASNGIGRVEMARQDISGGDYRFSQFAFIPVPEPASVLLIGASLIVLICSRRKRAL